MECTVKIVTDHYSVADKCTVYNGILKSAGKENFNNQGDRTSVVIVINLNFKLHPRKRYIFSTWTFYPLLPLP